MNISTIKQGLSDQYGFLKDAIYDHSSNQILIQFECGYYLLNLNTNQFCFYEFRKYLYDIHFNSKILTYHKVNDYWIIVYTVEDALHIDQICSDTLTNYLICNAPNPWTGAFGRNDRLLAIGDSKSAQIRVIDIIQKHISWSDSLTFPKERDIPNDPSLRVIGWSPDNQTIYTQTNYLWFKTFATWDYKNKTVSSIIE